MGPCGDCLMPHTPAFLLTAPVVLQRGDRAPAGHPGRAASVLASCSGTCCSPAGAVPPLLAGWLVLTAASRIIVSGPWLCLQLPTARRGVHCRETALWGTTNTPTWARPAAASTPSAAASTAGGVRTRRHWARPVTPVGRQRMALLQRLR